MEFQLKQQLNYSTCKLNDESKSFRGAKRRKQSAKSRLLDGIPLVATTTKSRRRRFLCHLMEEGYPKVTSSLAH